MATQHYCGNIGKLRWRSSSSALARSTASFFAAAVCRRCRVMAISASYRASRPLSMPLLLLRLLPCCVVDKNDALVVTALPCEAAFDDADADDGAAVASASASCTFCSHCAISASSAAASEAASATLRLALRDAAENDVAALESWLLLAAAADDEDDGAVGLARGFCGVLLVVVVIPAVVAANLPPLAAVTKRGC